MARALLGATALLVAVGGPALAASYFTGEGYVVTRHATYDILPAFEEVEHAQEHALPVVVCTRDAGNDTYACDAFPPGAMRIECRYATVNTTVAACHVVFPDRHCFEHPAPEVGERCEDNDGRFPPIVLDCTFWTDANGDHRATCTATRDGSEGACDLNLDARVALCRVTYPGAAPFPPTPPHDVCIASARLLPPALPPEIASPSALDDLPSEANSLRAAYESAHAETARAYEAFRAEVESRLVGACPGSFEAHFESTFEWHQSSTEGNWTDETAWRPAALRERDSFDELPHDLPDPSFGAALRGPGNPIEFESPRRH